MSERKAPEDLITENNDVIVHLDGEDYVMKPTWQAASRISKHFGGYGPAGQALANADVNAIEVIIAHGVGFTQLGQKGLGEKIFRTGVAESLAPCVAFLTLLINGGKKKVAEEATSTEGEV